MKFFWNTVMFIVSTAIILLIDAFVIKQLWAWLIADQFPGLFYLTYPQAVGISIFVGFMILHKPAADQEEKESWETQLEAFMFSLIACIVFFVIGWFAHLFM